MNHLYRKGEPKTGIWVAAAWALISAIFAFIVLFLVAYGFSEIKSISGETAEVFAYIIYDIIIGSACFLICRTVPKSIVFVPVLANMMGIVSSIAEPNFWNSSLWVLIVCGWILSIMTSLAGYILNTRPWGKR